MHQIWKVMAGLAVAGSLALSIPAYAQSNKVIATVNGAEVYQSDYDLAATLLARETANMTEDQRKQTILAVITDTLLMSQLAEEAGTDKTNDYQQRLKFTIRRVKRDIYIQHNVTDKVTDAEIEERYNALLKANPPARQVHARHILLKTEEEAKAVIKDLEGGADFVVLAKQKSTGPSGPKGGDLGFFGKGQMVPPFDKAVFAMKKGEITKTPVKTNFGWHVIKLEDERTQDVPTLADVSEQLRQILSTERLKAFMEAARAKAKIEYK